jgi:hypothetical protein
MTLATGRPIFSALVVKSTLKHLSSNFPLHHNEKNEREREREREMRKKKIEMERDGEKQKTERLVVLPENQ